MVVVAAAIRLVMIDNMIHLRVETHLIMREKENAIEVDQLTIVTIINVIEMIEEEMVAIDHHLANLAAGAVVAVMRDDDPIHLHLAPLQRPPPPPLLLVQLPSPPPLPLPLLLLLPLIVIVLLIALVLLVIIVTVIVIVSAGVHHLEEGSDRDHL